jgi:hypothetical protein
VLGAKAEFSDWLRTKLDNRGAATAAGNSTLEKKRIKTTTTDHTIEPDFTAFAFCKNCSVLD